MAKSRAKKSRKSIYLLLAFILLSSLGYGYYRSQLTPPKIFMIEETAVQYGNTTVTGTLRKDTAVGQSGNYLLVLADGRPILLDAQGLDGLLGSPVTATGSLSPAANSLSSMTMTVKTITVAEPQ